MKSVICIISFLLLSSSWCLSQTKAYDMSFDKRLIELGTVVKGEQKRGHFRFENTGEKPLRIELVSSCECTTLEWTRGNIAPGETGRVDFVFDSTEKEKSETVDVDIYFENIDPDTNDALFEIVQYSFILTQP